MSALHTVVRRATRIYTTHFPIDRGKWRMLRIMDPILRVHGKRELATVGGRFKMNLDLEDYIQSWIYFRGCYERPLFDFIVANVKPGDVFVDIGANVGQFSLLAASLGATVHAFEPSPDNMEALKRNLDLNPSLRIDCIPQRFPIMLDALSSSLMTSLDRTRIVGRALGQSR